MQEQVFEHLHKDVESIKKDIALIKHLLMGEGNLTEEAKERLSSARKEPQSAYKEM